MTVDDLNRGKLAGIAWRWRRVSLPAMITILFCVRNRIQDDNWLSVLEKIERELPATHDTSDQRDPALTDFLEAVDAVYAGSRLDKWTNGGTHWSVTGEPFWFTEPVKERVANIGNLEVWK